MKNIIKIFKRDIRNIFKNWVAVMIIFGLMVIPSLYSLINIKASWDPYSSTSGIKIAVVNEDKGTIFRDEDINLGNELVEKLEDNDKMGWTFVDKETAKSGLINETYYATIEIPENFSEDATTLVEKRVKRPKLIYTVNEKKNAIAPKMTDAGVKSVKGQLDDNIVKTVTGVIFRACDEIGIEMDEHRSEYRETIDEIYELDENMPEIENLLDSAINGTVDLSDLIVKVNDILPNVSNTVDITDDFLQDVQGFFDKTQGGLSDISPVIKDDLLLAENIFDTTSVELKNIQENIIPEVAKKTLITASDTINSANVLVDGVESQLKNIKKILDKVSKIDLSKFALNSTDENYINELKKRAESINSIKGNLKDISRKISKAIDKLDLLSDRLDTVKGRIDDEIDELNNGKELDTQSITDMINILDDLHKQVTEIIDNYDSELVPAIEDGFDSMKVILDNTSSVLQEGRDTLPDIEEILSVSSELSDLSNEELLKLKDKFPEMKDKVHELADKLREFDEEDKFNEIFDMITNDWQVQSDFLASPVEIEDNRLFAWPNYGSASTPFYTILCLWIGGYMLSIVLDTNAHSFEEDTELKSHEVYFGKLLLFLFVGIGQAVIASIGALALGSYCLHPVLFILYTVFVSIVFMVIIYTAVSVFGNAGIIFGVVLLVLQVAGTSGNFPIEVNPDMFQKMFGFLPFTYAISGMRQIMAGIVYSILFRDMIILTIFMVVFLIIGLTLRKTMNKKNEKFVKKLKESTIMNG
ncbi:YhgE/Pip domain-containing protein [Clostridium botulinum]|nr:YhgE/Pip domain-containing protein [Clostridium botulinum]NFR15589.1 YhgE/Pip domain-containing protein [Clostridium botulinum]NFR44330.1 YhgE/Pip domain-containing protein [Clostridium botulinum]NFS51504.1 YhgE/Pip domain-containing protein [Clostridium botulinum]